MTKLTKILLNEKSTDEIKYEKIDSLTSSDVKEIEKTLKELDDLYYSSGDTVNDFIYDKLKSIWKLLTGNNEYNYVPTENIPDEEKVYHPYNLLSLGKIDTYEEVIEYIKKFIPCMLQMKIDGLRFGGYPNTINVLTAPNQYTTYLAPYIFGTRGNGKVGCDKTLQVYYTGKIPTIYNVPITGEAYVKKSNLRYINSVLESRGEKTYSNCRAAVAGILNSEKSEFINLVDFFVYNIIGSTATQSDQLNWIYSAGLPTFLPENVVRVDSEDDIPKALEFIKRVGENRDSLDYEIDGIVIKSNIPNSLQVFGGCTMHHPKDAIAFKYESQGAWGVLKDVKWQVGRTGIITPKAEFDTINIAGVNVKNATLHNVYILKNLGAKIGCDIYVTRRHDVIPAVEKCVVKEGNVDIEIPTECPVCHEKLTLNGAGLFCTNTECTGRIETALKHLVSKDALNIDGLGEKICKKLVDLGYITTIYDLFHLTEQQFKDVAGDKNGRKIFKNLLQSRQMLQFDRFLYCCCIPNVGYSKSKDIANEFKTLENFIDCINDVNRHHEITDIQGIGNSIKDSIVNNKHLIIKMMCYITKILPIEDITSTDDSTNDKNLNLKVCITGVLSAPRTDIIKEFEQLGIKVTSSVTSSTDYLITNDTSSNSTKMKSAKANRVPIITEEAFRNNVINKSNCVPFSVGD